MAYKIKMFFLWIWTGIVNWAIENKEPLLGSFCGYLVVGSLLWAIADLNVMDGMLAFMRTGWLHDIAAIPTYIGLLLMLIAGSVYVVGLVILGFISTMKRMYASFEAFTIEGPKKKKKNSARWVETPDRPNPLDSMDASDFYFDDNGEFKEDEFDADFQRQLDEVNRRHRQHGQKKEDNLPKV